MNPTRVDIEWTFISPALKTASGILKVWEMDPDLLSTAQPKLLFRCKCKVSPGSRGFSAISEDEYIPSKLFEKYEHYIKCMVDSYYAGTILENKQFFWIPESLNNDTHNESNR